MDPADAAGILGGPVKLVEDAAGVLVKPIFGAWGIIVWLVTTWCELIVNILSVFAWLSWIGALLLMAAGQLVFGGFVLAFSLFLFADREFFKLVEFWLGGKAYTMPPAKFVGDMVVTAIAFVIIMGVLFLLWLIVPLPLLLALPLALAPLMILLSLSRYAKHILAMVKDQMAGKPAQAPAQKK